ncbi:expansin EXLX1 family cellulose-binding protein [Streptomyces sp. NPDC006172]|uniref:expansin EXLX1 family cellulose-binding protein n=1 Tax=Streptomyces sp. NPDC006172 TaxID=3154470 RepID=UPI0033E82AD3
MKAKRHAARRRPGRRGLWTTTTAALAALGLLAYLVITLRADPGAHTDASAGSRAGAAGRAAVATAASRPTPPATTAPATPSPSASPSPTATPSTTAPATPSASPTARASARAASRATSAGTPSAGRIRPGVDYSGVATHYDAGDGNGACLYGPTDDLMVAAMNHTDYDTAQACGAYIVVRTASGASVTVRVTNECPLPCAPGQVDLSKQAFAKLADLSAGRLSVTWSLLSPGTSDKISVRYKTGSSAYWCGIQVVGHRNPVARLEVAADGGWRALPRADFNYFLSEQGAGCGKSLRVTDIYGERLELDALPVRPDVLQPTGAQFSRR